MTEHEKKIYVKFKIEKSHGRDVMNGLIVSEDLDSINSWDGGKKEIEATESEDVSPAVSVSKFQSVSKEFRRSVSVYQSSVPFIMSTLPLIGQVIDDQRIRGFAKESGKCLESGEFELYEFPIEYIDRLKRLLDKTYAIKEGIDAIPRLFLLGLISAYDAFLSDLMRAIFITKPELLSSSEKNMSFKDLVGLGSIDAAREFIIEKEIESVIRLSHSDQIVWLEKKLGIPLRKDLKIWPAFIELCERRNIFTHTNGVVSSQYCRVCHEHGAGIKAKVGDVISVDAEYYKAATSVIFELGVKLTQVVWRKLSPVEIGDADHDVNNIAYDLITRRDYKSAECLLSFGLYEMKKHTSDAIKKMMIINYANAIKLGGNKEKAVSVISKEDWSASKDNYKICVAAVRDDVKAVISMMKQAVESKVLDISNLREWPVFEKARGDNEFVEAFEEIFGEKLLLNKQTVSHSADSSTDNEAEMADTGQELGDSEYKTRH